ncbi:polygalacturonase inhibitor-like [Iris pallida]|uniref:Polygalacturonase inhibitor-like n=1 Tax=Iris pallida TaxID=29817 RepID=A0AAX6GUC9_IRIPA|nr:polygalacturonase inhibitor-like [Iris pallida]
MQPNLHVPIPYNWSKLKNLETVAIYSTTSPAPSFVPLPAHFPPRTPPRLLQPLGSPPSFSGRPRQPQQSLVYTQQAHGDHPVDPLQQARQRHTARRPRPGRQPADGAIPKFLRPGPVPIHQSAGQPAQRRRFVPLRQVQTLLGSSDFGRNKLSFDLTNVEYPVKNVQYIDLATTRSTGASTSRSYKSYRRSILMWV